VLWSLAKRAVLFELRLYVSLLRWVARRPDHGGPADEPFGYAQAVTPVMWLWIFASAVEVPLVHVLIPWDGVRVAALALSIWGLLWMVGFLASLNVYPHLLGPELLRVRNGKGTDIAVPWESVAAVKVDRRDLESTIRTLQPRETPEGTDLQVAVSGHTNVTVRMRAPMTVRTSKGDLHVVAVSFLADDPRAVVSRARELAGAPR
jgi:hypothetical protein